MSWMNQVVIMGSGPNALSARNWARAPNQTFVAINNAWQVRPDWNLLIHPEDFPGCRCPQSLKPGQAIVTAADFVPIQNQFGGFVYAGGTMAFTAAYWVLGALRPSVIGLIGCDMVYPARGPTHFYGNGVADPLRDDITLRSLEAKSARFMLLAARAGCAAVNLSRESTSRLVFPRAKHDALDWIQPQAFDRQAVEQALAAETELDISNQLVATGK